MAELAPLLAKFLREHLPHHMGTSQHTVESYSLCFRLLAVFAAERHGIRPCQLEIGHLDIETILEFLEHLERNRGNGVRTRNLRLAAIKSFSGLSNSGAQNSSTLPRRCDKFRKRNASYHSSTPSTGKKRVRFSMRRTQQP